MNPYEVFKMKQKESKRVKLRKYSSMPDLQKENIEQILTKLRATSSSENVSKLIPIVKYKAELESYRRKTMQERLDEASPYNLFFNVMEIAPETYKQPNSIKFTDLLCPSLGKLKSSLHICYHVNIHWLMEQYQFMGLSDKPMTIITSSINDEEISDRYPNVVFRKVLKQSEHSGAHNSKISVFIYEDDSLRVTCGSVNPYYSDWNGVNQALWVSPKCAPLSDSSSGESITNFKSKLLEYLMQYQFDVLNTFIEVIENADFQQIRVVLVTCFPSTCTLEQPKSYSRVMSCTLKNVLIAPKNYSDWKIVMCSPCIGYLAKAYKSDSITYFRTYIMRPLSFYTEASMKGGSNIKYSIMFPCISDIMDNGILYNRHNTLRRISNRPQSWMGIQNYSKMVRMKLNGYGRSVAVLKASMYYRISSCSTKLAYFLLTSANLTKSSWGLVNTASFDPNRLKIPILVKSYEAGILFIPHFFNQDYFTVRSTEKQNYCKLFPMLTDPLSINYTNEDKPWSPVKWS